MQIAATAATLTKQIDIDQLADLIEASNITETLDLGVTFIHRAIHPEHGNIILVSTTGEGHAILST